MIWDLLWIYFFERFRDRASWNSSLAGQNIIAQEIYILIWKAENSLKY